MIFRVFFKKKSQEKCQNGFDTQKKQVINKQGPKLLKLAQNSEQTRYRWSNRL